MKAYTRRDFLKLCAVGMGALAFRPFFPQWEGLDGGEIVRIATVSTSVYVEPWDESKILYTRYRDELINVYHEVVSDKGPDWNPLWYRIWRGYIHSARLQKVKVVLNDIPSTIQGEKQLAEVTVPYTQTMRYTVYGWQPVYRLYYESVHWVVGIEDGPDGKPWYRVKDELLDAHSMDYHVPAQHLRLISADELTPISPDMPFNQKRVEVDLTRQHLIAYESGAVVMDTKISSGLNYRPFADKPSWNTPSGKFNVQVKMPSKHMGDGQLTSDLNAYELPGVPWCSFFAENGVALHGTYWHTNYGVPMSHGCVNMRPQDAKWIYRWLLPVSEKEDWDHKGYGTQIVVS